VGWAKTYCEENVGKVKHCENNINECVSKIEKKDLKKKFSETEKAELLLGYLSDLYPKKQENTES